MAFPDCFIQVYIPDSYFLSQQDLVQFVPLGRCQKSAFEMIDVTSGSARLSNGLVAIVQELANPLMRTTLHRPQVCKSRYGLLAPLGCVKGKYHIALPTPYSNSSHVLLAM